MSENSTLLEQLRAPVSMSMFARKSDMLLTLFQERRESAELIEELQGALEGLLATVARLDIREGVCCCGDDMENHADPMWCGHSPVDAGEYYHGAAIRAARDAVEKACAAHTPSIEQAPS